jgi:hypothetical protein
MSGNLNRLGIMQYERNRTDPTNDNHQKKNLLSVVMVMMVVMMRDVLVMINFTESVVFVRVELHNSKLCKRLTCVLHGVRDGIRDDVLDEFDESCSRNLFHLRPLPEKQGP